MRMTISAFQRCCAQSLGTSTSDMLRVMHFIVALSVSSSLKTTCAQQLIHNPGDDGICRAPEVLETELKFAVAMLGKSL